MRNTSFNVDQIYIDGSTNRQVKVIQHDKKTGRVQVQDGQLKKWVPEDWLKVIQDIPTIVRWAISLYNLFAKSPIKYK